MIGIIGAMDIEIEALVAQMTAKEQIDINHLKFFKGQLFGKEVVIVKCGVGKVNAAICTQTMILNFKVQKVINTGIAGATGAGLSIYDFVISTEAVHHDFDTQFFGYKLGQVPGLPETFKADSELVEKVYKAFDNTSFAKEHKIKKGLVASGDQFIAGGEKKNFIVSNFHPECVEMEGASIAHTCTVNKVPFVIIRCMSDCADENVQTTYSEEIAGNVSSGFLLEVIKEL